MLTVDIRLRPYMGLRTVKSITMQTFLLSFGIKAIDAVLWQELKNKNY